MDLSVGYDLIKLTKIHTLESLKKNLIKKMMFWEFWYDLMENPNGRVKLKKHKMWMH
jgi:hypothetical protein